MTTPGLQNGTNGSDTSGSEEDSSSIYAYPGYQKAAFVITWVELVLMLILNGIVIIGLLCRPRQNRLSFFVLHLAFTDFGMGLFYLLPDAILRTIHYWHAGITACSMYQYISHVMPYVSSFMLVVISLDRLYVIIQPLRSSRRGKTYRYTLVGVAWFIALLLAIPQPINAFIYTPNNNNSAILCDLYYETPEMAEAAVVIFVCGVMFVPAIIISICYSLIVYTIWVRMNKGIHIAPAKVRNSKHALGTFIQPKQKIRSGDSDQLENRSRSDIMTRAKIKSIIMTFVVVIVFILCWSPFCINVLLSVFAATPPGPSYFIFMALAPLNSAANPVIFMAFNWRLLQNKNRSPRNGTTTTTTTTSSFFSKKGILMRRVPNDDEPAP